MSQNDKLLIEQWLKNNEVIKIPEIKQKAPTVIPSTKKSIMDIPSMGDAIELYGEKQLRKIKKKEKKIDMTNIDKNLLPESLHSIINTLKNKEE